MRLFTFLVEIRCDSRCTSRLGNRRDISVHKQIDQHFTNYIIFHFYLAKLLTLAKFFERIASEAF